MPEVFRLPVPERLDPPNGARALMTNVRGHFYLLYNSEDTTFQEMLKSVGNKDAVTLNRLFDRHVAVTMIKAAAKQADDTITLEAKDGEIYKCMVHIMQRHEGLKLKLRRRQYREITNLQQAAE